MTIKQALKLKNRLVGEINDTQIKMIKYNSVSESNERPYSTKALLEQHYNLVNQLVVLKTEIHKANSEVYDKIFLLSELKNVVKHLKSLDCTNGVVEDDYYRRSSDTQTIKKSEISVVERDSEIKFLESRIDEIQEELDLHNSTTTLPGLEPSETDEDKTNE
jgi:hypothetical protein